MSDKTIEIVLNEPVIYKGAKFRTNQTLTVTESYLSTLPKASYSIKGAIEAEDQDDDSDDETVVSMKLTRDELEQVAADLGCTEEEIKACKNKQDVFDLIESANEDQDESEEGTEDDSEEDESEEGTEDDAVEK